MFQDPGERDKMLALTRYRDIDLAANQPSSLAHTEKTRRSYEISTLAAKLKKLTRYLTRRFSTSISLVGPYRLTIDSVGRSRHGHGW